MSTEAQIINVWGPLSPQGLYPADLYLTPQIFSKHQLLTSLHGAKDNSRDLGELLSTTTKSAGKHTQGEGTQAWTKLAAHQTPPL